MKKKIRWKMLGSLRVFHCWLAAIGAFLFKRNNFAIAILLILLSLAIFNVEAKIDPNHYANDSKRHSSFEGLMQRSNGDTISDLENSGSSTISIINNQKLFRIDCRNLKVGQFLCPEPTIDPDTQQPIGCAANNLAPISCTLREGLICDNDTEVPNGADPPKPPSVQLAIACQHTNGYSYEITLLLSIFFGMFGLDRFYLGYPGIGLLKFCTLGFLFIGQFIDIILIAMQIVRPADGSYYIIKYFGPKLMIRKAPYLEEVLPEFDAINATLVFKSTYELFFYPNASFT